MNFRKLKIFYETASSLNMTEAGKKLYISQPSVSQAIRELENELEVKLFDRIGKKLYLTNEGEIYLKFVSRILNLNEEVKIMLDDLKNNVTGKIKIGASTTIGTYILPNVIKSFLEKNKDVEISIVIENTEDIEKLILDNDVDIAFVEGDVNSKDIVKEELWKDKLVFVKAKDIDIEYKEKIPLIMRERGSGTRDIIETNLKNSNVDYSICMELGSTELILKVVEVGLGIACVPYRCVEKEIKEGILEEVFIDGVKEIKRDFRFIYHEDKFLSNTMKAFLEELKSYK
ncbi:LysR family transcriptional regulator [Clostridium mediterraneense]|uniref:LysR family transcriptional regulator n=1 Tax=Clostridium mediterraneense TaxID=1805472 RepID=UPI000830E434|nr:LysR family transcriptional regulator [Clostridium mediterraneense]